MDIDENMSEALYVKLLELEDTVRRNLKQEHLDIKEKSWGTPMTNGTLNLTFLLIYLNGLIPSALIWKNLLRARIYRGWTKQYEQC